MAVRPWATPEEVREYSDIKAVQERTDERIAVDISRAEQYVISYTNNDFSIEYLVCGGSAVADWDFTSSFFVIIYLR